MAKHHMKDIGQTSGAVPETGNARYYPSLTVDAKDFPKIKDWPLGEENFVQMKVVKVSDELEGPEGKKKERMRLELRGMEILDEDFLKELGYRAKT